MGSESSRPTPLGVARARFVDGLPRKAAELRGSIALLAATPADERPREELRRRLHALYASAQVFQIGPLSSALKDAIARLDRARDEKRALSDDDIDALANVASTLPVLGEAEPAAMAIDDDDAPTSPGSAPAIPRAPAVPSGPRASAPSRVRTLDSMPAAAPSEPPQRPPSERPSQRLRERTTLRGLQTPAMGTASPVIIHGAVSPVITHAAPSSTPPRSTALDTVVSVLVVDAAEWQARVRAVLPAERFEVLGAADPEEALRIARSSAPDAVLVDHALLMRPDVELVRRLREDPLTDFVPVIAMVKAGGHVDRITLRELGADEVLTKPLDPTELEATLARLAGGPRGALAGLSGEHTIDEVATRIAEEVKRGLTDSADRGRDLKLPLGDGAEVLAAAWSAIGRVRAHLAQRSGGRLHFRDDRAPGGPAFLALVEDDDDTPEPRSAPVSLRERHVIVVDDDPAVVWFFSGLLREEGAVVEEAADGAEALELARKKRPDVVISDILMPKLDGFALTRELKRDPALADVPVILLSWKDDFLQRMRELQSGASGYLRKEAAATQILECVRDVLRPRARLEAQLRAGGDVRGRLERIGILPLIKTTAQQRPDARVTVRDAWNLFELDLRGGNLVDLTRTASDGSFTRGPRVLVPLLGATAGRFAIADADTSVRASIKEPLDSVLETGAAQIGALVDAVSGKGVALAAQIDLDEDVVASLMRASPEPMRETVELLRSGQGPRALLLSGSIAPHELESVLLDLARQGAITGVRGEGGEDRIALASRLRGQIELPTRTPSIIPRAGTLELTNASEDAPSDLSWLATEQETGQIVAETHRMASEPPPSRSEPPVVTLADEPREDPAPHDDDALQASLEPKEEPALQASLEPKEDPAPQASLDSPGDPAPLDPATAKDVRSADVAAAPAPVAAPFEPAPVASTREAATRAAAPARPKAPAKPAPHAGRGMSLLGWSLLVMALGVAGFVAVSKLLEGGRTSVEVAHEAPLAAEEGAEEVPPTPTTAGHEPVDPEPNTPAIAPAVSSYGEAEPGIVASFGVDVAPGQGLVVLQPASDGSPLRVRLGGTEHVVAAEPVAIALAEGTHEVAFVHGDDLSFRFVFVEAGHTRRVPPP